MAQAVTILAALSCVAWCYLIFFHGGFWRADQRLGTGHVDELKDWPEVLVVIPARNEADVIGQTVVSLLAQDYPNPVSVLIVDDNSDDGTATVARRAADDVGHADRLTVLDGTPLKLGWVGKVWAMAQGASHADEVAPQARYILFTDADIVHDQSNLRRLVVLAETKGKDLTSIMVLLATQGVWERFLIPPFVFFFQMLYPFSQVNDDTQKVAAAAGGCMLIRRSVLEKAGGLPAIRDALIDDCTLARRIGSAGGRLWLGLDSKTRSTRPYGGLRGIWNMVARSAYTQLRYSPWLLAGCIMGMTVVYAVPPIAVLGGAWFGQSAIWFGLIAYLLMCAAYLPTLKLYDRPWIVAVLLPIAALFYAAMTVASACRHWRGVGGGWKGRVYPQ